MIRIKSIAPWLIVIPVLFLIACATGKQPYDIGMQLYSAGKYQDAIAYVKQAIAAEPSNKTYQQALSDIKNDFIKRLVSEGLQLIDVEGSITLADISKARSLLSESQGIDADHSDVERLAGRFEQRERFFLSEMKTLYSQAQEQLKNEEWLKASFNLQQIQSQYPNYENTPQMISDTVSRGTEDYYQQGRSLFEKDAFEKAIAYFRKALSLKDNHQPSRELLALSQENNNAEYFIKRGEEARNAGQWGTAIEMYERALVYSPDSYELKNLIADVQRNTTKFNMETAQMQMESGLLFNAIESFKKASQGQEELTDYRLINLRANLASHANALSERFKSQRRFGAAWYWYALINTINPEYPNIFHLTQSMEDQIKERVRKSIAVFDFNSPSNSQDAGLIVANNLITFLFKNASGDIKILERENLKSILEEMKLGQTGIVSEQTAQEIGRVYGVDVAIMGNVLIYNVDSIVSTGNKTVKYQVGTEIQDNIDYLNWKARNPNPNEKLLRSAPPAKISAPKYETREYDVSTIRKIGFIQIAFRIVDVATGENIQVDTIERKEIVQDQSSAGVPEANIKFDPMEISSDTELIQKLTDEVIAELGREALKPLQNLEKKYFEEGELLLRRRNNLMAAEKFIDAIFDEQLKMVQNSPMTAKAREYLEDIFRNFNANQGS